jgi:uncharacterized protein YbjT (DUF2867 family)
MTIAVHGATGSQGAPVAALLTAAGHDVRPLSRANADLLDRAALEAAYAGADAVVAQLPLVYDARALTMGHNVARAAEAAGVAHLVVNTSGPFGHEPIGVPFVDARHRAASADVPRVTLLQPTTYLENLSAPWSTVAEGELSYPRPADAVLQWVATEDVALVAVRALEEGLTGRFDLPGEALSGTELAAALTGALGREVRYRELTPAEFAERLRPHLGEHAAAGTAAVYEFPPVLSPPSTLAGWAPRSAAAWAREAFPLGVAV